MKHTITTLSVCLLLVTLVMDPVAADQLRHNPFEQPELDADRFGSGGKKSRGNSMELRGTLIDGDDSLANIGGKYYRLNEEITGYRLVRIEYGSVTLARGRSETVLTLNNEK